MATDKRQNQNLTKDDVQKYLNEKQLASIRESAYFGWKVKFIRRPLFLEPIVVIYNTRFDMIGILEPDGRINTQTDIKIRSSGHLINEKRKGMAPIPSEYEKLLNSAQLSTLRKIEGTGLALQFIRRSQSNYPIAILMSTKSNKFAKLEKDGRLLFMSNSAVRKDTTEEGEPRLATLIL